jgi:hypothetical protein
MVEVDCRLLVVFSVAGEGIRLASISLDAPPCDGSVVYDEWEVLV